VALRTQQIIAYETGAADSIDPLAGSYLIEHLTDVIDQQATALIAEIDARGGALAAIESGYIQSEIQQAAYAYQRAVEAGDEIIVGVNKFTVEEEQRYDILTVDPAIEAAQRARLADLRARRDNERVSALRDRLVQAARGTDNLMPIILACVEGDVTLGEICHSLRSVFGEYRPPITL